MPSPKDHGLEVWQSECLVQAAAAVGPYHQQLSKVSPGTVRISVVAIGSFYYGALAAGLIVFDSAVFEDVQS